MKQPASTEQAGSLSNAPQSKGCREIAILEPVVSSRWRAFVASHPAATIFHHPAWLALIQDQYQCKTSAICLASGSSIVAGIPFCDIGGPLALRGRRFVCLPVSDYCGPLSSSHADLHLLMEHVRALTMQYKARVEIRDGLSTERAFRLGEPHWFHATDLSCEPNELFKSFQSRVRRSIRKAQKGGLRTEIRRDERAIAIFYELHLKTRRRQGVPVQPRAYFARLHDHIVSAGLGFVSITGDGAHDMSAGVFCGFGKALTYKYGASDPAYLDRAPNHLMFWDTMLYAMRAGFGNFDFGKTAHGNAGLRSFKNGWNSVERQAAYSYFPEAPSGTLFSVINEKLIGPVIRHSPPFVCRLAGEALYRTFALR